MIEWPKNSLVRTFSAFEAKFISLIRGFLTAHHFQVFVAIFYAFVTAQPITVLVLVKLERFSTECSKTKTETKLIT